MGMDVYGNNPRSERGEYFRNNVWWWRPLAEYCENVHPDLVGDAEMWHYNDGYGLDDAGATALGQALVSDLADGTAEDWEKEYRQFLADLPRQDCELCGTTGIRTDEVGVKMGQHERALDAEVAILVGRDFGWCNGCNGVGTRENWAAGYPFSLDNLREFANFLVECGGFRIC
jgi:hypothetical protein